MTYIEMTKTLCGHQSDDLKNKRHFLFFKFVMRIHRKF